MRRLVALIVQRLRVERGVALLSALMFMVIMAGLSVVLLSMVLGQIVPANIAQKNTQTIYAAQAGLETSLNMLRSAAKTDPTGHVFGDKGDLRCALTGRVDAQSNGRTYSAQVAYFTTDPTNETVQWQTANEYGCPARPAGTVKFTGATQPKYAVVTSTGLGEPIPGIADPGAGTRRLVAVYKFKVSNVNIPGGRILDATSTHCLEAPATASDKKIIFKPMSACADPKDPRQLWVYGDDYEIKLASTTVPGEIPLCITGPATSGGGDQDATLEECQSGPDRWNQLWSWTGSYTWQGQKKKISDGPSNYYLTGTFANGNHLRVQTSISGTFTPSSAVGAGPAGYSTHQIVNYQEFGRCADVTNEQIASTFMISYPCKQDPSGSATGTYLKWNHKWYYTEPAVGETSTPPQQIYVNVNDDTSKKYCLQTSAAGAGSFPTFKTPCKSSNALQQWTRVGNTGTYLNSYLFIDSNGYCLTADPTKLFNSFYSEITVATCDGSLAQKWNAPPAYVDSTVGGYREISG